MTKQHQITGLGPKQPDGSMEIFTILPRPFHVTAAWIEEQPKAPAMGDVIEVDDKGALTLLAEPWTGTPHASAAVAAHNAAASAKEAAEEAQKKSAGFVGLFSGLKSSHDREKLGNEAIAKVCHEANRAYCEAIGDPSQFPWEEAPDWQRESAVKGVEFNIANPDAPPSASHESWLEVKRADGWTYGPVKDAQRKTHPCFMPYDGLPLEQRRKDALFKAVVAALTQE